MDVFFFFFFFFFFWGGGRVGGVGLGGQGKCEHRSEVFAKIKKKLWGGGGGSVRGWGGGCSSWGGGVKVDVNEELKFFVRGVGLGGGQGGCERRIEVFVKIQKKKKELGGGGGEGSGWGVRVDVIEELKFLGKFTKKKFGREGGGGGRVGGSRWM